MSRSHLVLLQLSRKSSQDSSKKDPRPTPVSFLPPPPPTKNTPPPPRSVPQQPRPVSEPPPPAPPIVVVSPDPSPDQHHRLPTTDRLSLDHSNGNVPRTSTLNRLRAGPKDTIPIVGKPPRKQRSSRFVVTEKVDIERLPPFMGSSLLLSLIHPHISPQKPLPANVPSSSSRSSTNAASCSISMMQVQSSRANKSKPRLFTKCSSISPPRELSSLRMYTQRLLAW